MPSSIFFLAVATLLSSPVLADKLPELLIPVTGKEEQRVLEEQSFFVKRNTYLAKRHRIVRVNSDVLFNEPRFRITFFDDASITVRRESVEQGDLITWRGQMENQPISIEEMVRAGDSPSDARDSYSALVDVSIHAAKQVYDPETRRSGHLFGLDLKTLRPMNTVDRSKGQYAFYAAGAKISPLSLRKTYRLRPLELDGRYHILYEVDPAKRTTPGMFGGPVGKTDMEHRYRQYRQYLERLGPDPRDSQ